MPWYFASLPQLLALIIVDIENKSKEMSSSSEVKRD